MQQIYRRTPMPKCDFIENNFIEITLRHGCSPVDLLHIFRTPFPRNTFEWLLLTIFPCCRSSRPRVFWKKRSSKKLSKLSCKIHEKTPVPQFLLDKVGGLAWNFNKKEAPAQVSSCEYCNFFRNSFFYRTPPAAVSV